MRCSLVLAACAVSVLACSGGDSPAAPAPDHDAGEMHSDTGPRRVDAVPPPPFTASPTHASMFGQVSVTLEGKFEKIGTVDSVTLNDILALDVTTTSSSITFLIQGGPTPGPVHIVVHGATATLSDDTAFSYDPPTGGAPTKWGAFGASLTEGFESAGLQQHGQTMSWDAQIARSAGVFLGLARVVDSALPPIEPSVYVANCNAVWNESSIATTLVAAVTDPKTKMVDLRLARQDPTLATRNVAVGGALVSDIINPAVGVVGILERIAELPDGDPIGLVGHTLTKSQIDRIVELDPDIGLSADLLANDSDGSVTQSDDLHPEVMTTVAVLTPELATLAMRLGALHGQYFIGNLLPIDGLPNVAVLRNTTIAAGTETTSTFDAKLTTIQDTITAYNQALAAALAPYPNLHLIDLWTPTQTALTEGLVVGGTKLTGLEFGGLLSLDFIHFTDTGYAFLANTFIDDINATAHLHLAKVDLASVLANDALSSANLAADGIQCPAL